MISRIVGVMSDDVIMLFRAVEDRLPKLTALAKLTSPSQTEWPLVDVERFFLKYGSVLSPLRQSHQLTV